MAELLPRRLHHKLIIDQQGLTSTPAIPSLMEAVCRSSSRRLVQI
ncbi:hypothetical protein M6B38_313330 [Iris pallida]|uniref:Uncharacterized protein n=1 Tax=Iris pallida TaxID=29817 RepID=A0AAX6HFQ5_IRIPA|nr:hypothetical protein M6B38_313330 [Iris pallida]